MEVLKNSTNTDIYYFNDTISKIYTYNNGYENDITIIKDFIRKFPLDEIKGQTKKIALNSLIKTLKSISWINEQY